MKEAYFQGFHSGIYGPGERDLIGTYFKLKHFSPAKPCYKPKPKENLVGNQS